MTPPDVLELPLEAFDLLATMVAVVRPSGECLYVNAKLEDTMGASRRTLMRGNLLEWLTEADTLRATLAATAANVVATGRFDAQLRRTALGGTEILPVHVIVTQTERFDRLVVELVEIEQQARIDREERTIGLAQANKELLRNLAHEIKNPLGGIRGAAQLLAMELPSSELAEYTNVIIHEADRLQLLVDRLLAPHRRPHVVDDVNIHEVCERVRSVVLAEFPRGLRIARDYDTSIPEFRADREQLIQALLNVVHNAAQALSSRMAIGDARIELRTRVARQVTIGKQRFRLALELHVQDNGPGVPEAIRDCIFHPLVSGRDGGTGLGLTLAQTFVQQHRGTIACDSVPGRTVFTITIPLP
jgi:two-component system nitrogen regulation sensor histidine kinase GlnL